MAEKPKKRAAPKRKADAYKMPSPIPVGEVITDSLLKKKWRFGPSIGVGGFGEIYSVCNHESSPKKGSDYPYVIKIEPHENGPLFVEKHFYLRNANKNDIAQFMKDKKLTSLGMPTYHGNGSHEYKGEKYRYLVLERYGKNIWNLFLDNGRKFPTNTVFQLGLQMLDVLEYIHSKGYVHADIKGANILLGLKKGTENQAYLVDYGLATRVNDKDFKPDPKCAHNGTIEYTSRDAHLGVATMRGDLEILGYNMLQWLEGELPWEKSLTQPKVVQDMKEQFMKNVRTNITSKYKNVPDALIKYFEYVNALKPKEKPDHLKCRKLFETYLKSEGRTVNSKLEFVTSKRSKVVDDKDEEEKPIKKQKKSVKKKNNSEIAENEQNDDRVKVKKIIKKKLEIAENNENAIPKGVKIKKLKRKSLEPAVITKLKKKKLTPKSTPPPKKDHVNTATQTSVDKLRRSPRSVSFDSPVSEIMGEKSSISNSVNSSGDLFDDSFTITGKKLKTKRKLLSDEIVTVKRVVKKKVTTVKTKGKSWKDCPAVVNGRSPPV